MRNLAIVVGLCSLLSLLAGCGSGEPVVTGTVSYKGQPLPGGNVYFVGADGTTREATIERDGSYKMTNPPTGQVSAAVKVPDYRPPAKPTAPRGDAPDPGGAGKVATFTPVNVPSKYANPKISGLTYNVAGGNQRIDITLD